MLDVLNITSDKYINVNYIRDEAYHFLLKENVNSLPVNAAGIMRNRPYAYLYYSDFKNTPADELYKNYGNAFISPRPGPDQYFLGINDNCDPFEYNWAIMKMLAYIELGHATALHGDFLWRFSWNFAEMESDLFSLFALCPDIVAQKIQLLGVEDIHILCKLPYNQANQKSKYFRGFNYKIDSILPKNPIEQKVVFNFRNFIKEYNNKYKYEFASEFA